MQIDKFISTLNRYGSERVPFLFVVDFEMENPLVFELAAIDPGHLLYDLNGKSNCVEEWPVVGGFEFEKIPPAFDGYREKFNTVRSRMIYGDSYLTNLTIKTEVRTSLSLKDFFYLSDARYKLWLDEMFVVFSPETFVRIEDGIISAYPMKGTIDASLPDAQSRVLKDAKEMAEHVTIVDLIRNDLSVVADQVTVTRFRYVEEIRTMQKNLLQVSSEIQGKLPRKYQARLGEILVKLLPAGSVSGAPKDKTLEIIRTAEKERRGYYTGVVGYYDGTVLDSGVMIRFLERDGPRLFYRSGGGITVQSEVHAEYQEAIDKIYVPVD